MAAVRFSQCFTRSDFAQTIDYICMRTLRYAVVRCCNFCGTHAGIDPASPAVVEASVSIYLSVYLSLFLAVDIGTSQFNQLLLMQPTTNAK